MALLRYIRTIWLCITNVLIRVRMVRHIATKDGDVAKGNFEKKNIKFIIKKNENYINNVGFACVEKFCILMINLF